MKIPPYVRRALRAWLSWRAHNRLCAACPELRTLDQRQRLNARQHRAGSREIAKAKRRVINARLAMELGRQV
jgi:hypothetical protein